jgi:hypothetical protein
VSVAERSENELLVGALDERGVVVAEQHVVSHQKVDDSRPPRSSLQLRGSDRCPHPALQCVILKEVIREVGALEMAGVPTHVDQPHALIRPPGDRRCEVGFMAGEERAGERHADDGDDRTQLNQPSTRGVGGHRNVY